MEKETAYRINRHTIVNVKSDGHGCKVVIFNNLGSVVAEVPGHYYEDTGHLERVWSGIDQARIEWVDEYSIGSLGPVVLFGSQVAPTPTKIVRKSAEK